MGDYFLDFRRRDLRSQHVEPLRFFPDMTVDRVERSDFTLFTTRTGRDELWAPFEAGDGVVVALAGSIAFPPEDWQAASRVEGPGGLACKALYRAYVEHGIEGLVRSSGAFAIHVYDPRRKLYYLVCDSGGVLPCYTTTSSEEVVCSHPDFLAASSGGGTSNSQSSWDLTSMAQFIATGVVTFPFSFYRYVTALDYGCVHCFTMVAPGAIRRRSTPHAGTQIVAGSSASEDTLAEQLASAIARAARHRTLPILGRTAVALSGGLDSRTILCAAQSHGELFAFCAFDEQNAEYGVAKDIADTLGVRLVPFPREFDHYGDHAEAGVRVSGGMGELASNHFLGFRSRLRELGMENLVTGCYFDYLFKSLALDSREVGLLREERVASFAYQTYLPHFAIAPSFSSAVLARLSSLFPEADRATQDTAARARNAMRRIFPLYHEGDNAQRLIPLRVMGWNPPSVDPSVLELSRIIPPEMKLNKRLFRKVVQRICSKEVQRVPDNNTGLPVSASRLHVAINRYRHALRHRIERRQRRMVTAESWPNWPYYVHRSDKLRRLWSRTNPLARELISAICAEPFSADIAAYGGRPTQYFMRLLTLKLWLDQRCEQNATP